MEEEEAERRKAERREGTQLSQEWRVGHVLGIILCETTWRDKVLESHAKPKNSRFLGGFFFKQEISCKMR